MEQENRKTIRMSPKDRSYVLSISKPRENFSDTIRRILDDHRSLRRPTDNGSPYRPPSHTPNAQPEVLEALLASMEAVADKLSRLEARVHEMDHKLSQVKNVTDDIFEEGQP